MIAVGIEALSGRELDKYGESIGIPRYQGLGRPESDEEYRKTLRVSFLEKSSGKVLTEEIFHDNEKPLFAVLVIDKVNNRVVRIASRYNQDSLALFNTKYQAKCEAEKWTDCSSSSSPYVFEVHKVSLFKKV